MQVPQRDIRRPPFPVDEPSTVDLPAGHVKQPGHRPLPTAVRFDHNHAFPMRDGVKLRADVFRPVDSDAVPVPAIVVWGPYGKTSTGALVIDKVPLRSGVAKSRLSGYDSFEGPDPAEWVARGYAVVNVDSRGSGDSEGNLRIWGTPEGQDGHDFVEQIAAQPWCSGRVALAGNSWLAIVQWFVAREHPPHLTCIAPMEGLSDALRENVGRGGIDNSVFFRMIASTLTGRAEQEDLAKMFETDPYRNEYWDDKRVDFGQIQVPAYIVASYSTGLHNPGSFRAFDEIPHSKKWLSVHSTQEWYDLVSDERVEDLARFFDFYMKDVQNGWEETSPVRLSLLGYNLPPEVKTLQALPWTQPGCAKLKLHLNADQSMRESHAAAAATTTLSYQADVPARQADSDAGELLFRYTFPRKALLAGPSKLVVHMSAEVQDDLDVYVQLRKADAHGNILRYLNVPLADLGVASESDVPLTNTLQHLGPTGQLRASMRAVDPELSTPYWQTLSHDRAQVQPVARGEVVRLEVYIWPAGMVFEAGESLVLKMAGHDMALAEFEHLHGSFRVVNQGKHFVHFGEATENYLEAYVLQDWNGESLPT